MKKLLTGLCVIAIAVLQSCQSNTDQHETTADSMNHSAPGQNEHDHHGAVSGDESLSLNNGQKWVADHSTVMHVAGLKTVADNFAANTNPTAADYSSAGKEMTDTLNTLISECSMAGPDHEELHMWLEPLMNSVKELQNATSVEAGKTAMQDIVARLNLFDQYFAEQK